MVKIRRYIGDYSYRKRYLGIRAVDRLEIRQLRQRIMCLVMWKGLPSHVRSAALSHMFAVYRTMVVESGEPLERPLALRHRTIDSYGTSDIPHLFRFRSADQLHQLMEHLLIPEHVMLDNGVVMGGEELLLLGLRRLAAPNFHKSEQHLSLC